ncbi:Rad52/22 double-strand break repair protein, partial [Ceraceosorus guamensis]
MLACFASASGSENGPSPFPASQSVPPRPGVDGLRQISALQTALNRRLGPEYIQTRAGYGTGGKKLSYLEGWKAIDLANEVFGFNGWSTSIVRMDTDFCDVDNDGKVRIGMSCIIRITLRDGTFHEDVGYGAMEGSKHKGQAFEKARKEATTDAFKRALRSFGRMVGNCLYDRTFTDQLAK